MMEELLAILEARHTLTETPFRSRVPLIGGLIAWLRTQWNNVATRWYVLPLLQQQNEVNALWFAIFKEQAQGFQRQLTLLEEDQVEVIQQVAEMEYSLQCLEQRLMSLEATIHTEVD